ncbi:hypothetical protein B0A52_05209 [Exophiala mesophila]|uniref:Mid2 domain-containing protein n=1 Tax=Exophiala mesophila TaxID=212818 RepID=A0A438N4T6_EXOME|nr:hypothetical protein B0A52_05209 [Exophiala mesophila]
MEPPFKRIRISDPDVRNPRDTGSRRAEGLFTSEMAFQGGETDSEPKPTRVVSPTDIHRQDIYGQYQRLPRPILPKRNAGFYLVPRAPEATVTTNVIEVNVNDGTTISKITEVPADPTGAVVSLSDVGSLTVPPITDSSTIVTPTDDPSKDTLATPAPTALPSDILISSTSSSELTPSDTLLPETLNSTTTTSQFDTTTTEELTVTVTATSTYEISLTNGTIIATAYFATNKTLTTTPDARVTAAVTASSTPYTFGQLFTTSSSEPLETNTAPLTSFPGAAASGTLGSPVETTTSSAAPESETSSTGSTGPGLTPAQQTVVGGVVGGVAGIALALVIVLFVLRWYRRRLKSRGQLPEQIATREIGHSHGPSDPMSQRSSVVPFAAAVAQNFKRLRPHSTHTFTTSGTGTTDPHARDSERGFQRIAGRKIAPVLGVDGGDPYGGNYGAFEKDTGGDLNDPLQGGERGLSGASFYRDSQGFYGGNGTHSPTFPPSPTIETAGTSTGGTPTARGASSEKGFTGAYTPVNMNASQMSLGSPSRPDGYAFIRPSPARTPVTLSPAASSIRLPIQQTPVMDEQAPPLPMGLSIHGITRDEVGRSLASQDGSRISKSSGRSGGRFVENM